jgi:hypothetical protein
MTLLEHLMVGIYSIVVLINGLKLPLLLGGTIIIALAITTVWTWAERRKNEH